MGAPYAEPGYCQDDLSQKTPFRLWQVELLYWLFCRRIQFCFLHDISIPDLFIPLHTDIDIFLLFFLPGKNAVAIFLYCHHKSYPGEHVLRQFFMAYLETFYFIKLKP